MTPGEIHKRLSRILGEELQTPEDLGAGDRLVLVPSALWKQACRLAGDDQELSFDFLRSLCGVDFPGANALEVVAHLFSYRHRHALVLKTRIDRNAPKLESVAEVWPAAIWHERETFDLLGVCFTGNPDLRRILLPEDWVGHPLRKDYQEPQSYRGIPTTRPGYQKSRETE